VVTDAKETVDWLASQYKSMVKLLQQWSAINSGTYNIIGLANMRDALLTSFAALDAESNVIALPPFSHLTPSGERQADPLGAALNFSKRPHAPHQLLFCGHMDTVYGSEHPFQHYTQLDEHLLRGPGVADMKGGLVILLYTLLALERSPWAKQIGWEVLITPDEEIGSPGSRGLLAKAANRHHLGFIFEPALDSHGLLAGARKGSAKLSLVVHGKAAHAGRAFNEGCNSIVALSELIMQLDKLNGQRAGVTVNVGQISGGVAVNVVPDKAFCAVDIRTQDSLDEDWLKTAVSEIMTSHGLRPGIRIEYDLDFTRPPKALTDKTLNLFLALQETGKSIGQTITWQTSGGCCDGNNLAAAGLPTVDSLGVSGGNIHTEQEYIVLPSLLERSSLLTQFICDLANGVIQL
jgi:glutamate carboxypeptidase